MDERAEAAMDAKTPQMSPKARSLSDSTPRLDPSPKFREPAARMSKDDHTLSPTTPRRPDFLSRGLSLQMPPRETPMPSPAHFAARVPLSPQLDARNTYATAVSPASLLPRRSRGAEFSRACTNLHHSTLPEQSSPDSSPTITQKGIKIPQRKPRSNSMLMNSPNINMHGGWSNNGDRTAASSSVGSMNMLGSDESSSSSDEIDPLDPDDHDDPMLGTPQAKMSLAFPGGGPGAGWATNLFSPIAGGLPSFMSIQRARLRKGRSRKRSSSTSGHSSLASPGPASPPNGIVKGENHFSREAAIRKAGSRRESLSLFANDLHISSGNDSGDEASGLPHTPGVVRRPVVRRGNLLVSQSSLVDMCYANFFSQSQDSLAASRQSFSKSLRLLTASSAARQRSFAKYEKLMRAPHLQHNHLQAYCQVYPIWTVRWKEYQRKKAKAI
jgi:hypothetical protein